MGASFYRRSQFRKKENAMFRNLLDRVLAIGVLFAVGAMALSPGAAVAAPPQMIVYRAGERVPESELIDLGPPEGLGGIVLEGDPKISARIDYAKGNVLA